MALKFRRGDASQKSGSLQFGEPYVNTTLNTLQVGGASGDITLATAIDASATLTPGIVSASNFISTSFLHVTDDAEIKGNLTLGGNITIGNQTTDVVNVVANLSSSLIPSDDNVFDIGATSKRYKNVYASELNTSHISIESTGSAEIHINNTAAGTDYHIRNGATGNFIIFNAATSRPILSANSASINDIESVRIDGELIVTGQLISFGQISGSSLIGIGNASEYSASVESKIAALGVETSNLESFTSSINTTIKGQLDANTVVSGSSQVSYTGLSNIPVGIVSGSSQITSLLPNGVISGSSQVVLSDTNGFSTFSSSVDSRISTEKNRVDAILSASTADADSFAEIVALINSVDTTNDQAFAAFYTASNGRLNNLESTSASVNISVNNLNGFTSSINTTIKGQLDANTVVSGSSQVIGILSSLNSYTQSNDTTNTTQNTRLTALEASASIALSTNDSQATSITNLNSTTASLNISVSNLNGFTSSINTTIKNQLNANTVISGSSQVTGITNGQLVNSAITIAGTSVSLGGSITLASITAGSGIVSGSSQVSYTGLSNIPAGIVSGSSQITLSSTTGGGTTANVRFGSLGIGMDASGTSGRIDAANDIVAFSSSDIRFKENIKPIENPIQKIRQISGNTYDWKAENKEFHGYEGNDVGVIAQEVEAVLPQLVQTRENGYKAVKYDKLVALLIEAVKEQQLQIEQLRIDLNNCKTNKGL